MATRLSLEAWSLISVAVAHCTRNWRLEKMIASISGKLVSDLPPMTFPT